MATTEVQLSERQPILTTDEVVLTNPAAPVETSTTVVRK